MQQSRFLFEPSPLEHQSRYFLAQRSYFEPQHSSFLLGRSPLERQGKI